MGGNPLLAVAACIENHKQHHRNLCKLECLLRLLGLCEALTFAVAQNLQECKDSFDPFPLGSALFPILSFPS